MEEAKLKKISVKNITLTYEHNPYETHIFHPKKSNGKVIVFPIFNYQGYKQFVDLIYPKIGRAHV